MSVTVLNASGGPVMFGIAANSNASTVEGSANPPSITPAPLPTNASVQVPMSTNGLYTFAVVFTNNAPTTPVLVTWQYTDAYSVFDSTGTITDYDTGAIDHKLSWDSNTSTLTIYAVNQPPPVSTVSFKVTNGTQSTNALTISSTNSSCQTCISGSKTASIEIGDSADVILVVGSVFNLVVWVDSSMTTQDSVTSITADTVGMSMGGPQYPGSTHKYSLTQMSPTEITVVDVNTPAPPTMAYFQVTNNTTTANDVTVSANDSTSCVNCFTSPSGMKSNTATLNTNSVYTVAYPQDSSFGLVVWQGAFRSGTEDSISTYSTTGTVPSLTTNYTATLPKYALVLDSTNPKIPIVRIMNYSSGGGGGGGGGGDHGGGGGGKRRPPAGTPPATPPTSSSPRPTWLVPVLIVGGGALVAILLGVLLWWVRRRRARA